MTPHAVLTTADALLLDFDGPVCALFANLPARHVADRLRRLLAADLPAGIEGTGDPFDVFRHAATLGVEEARTVQAALRAHELEAAATATPTPGAHDLVRAWHATGRKLAVVSNNSRAAVDAYLRLHGLAGLVHAVSARTEPDPALLKPSPHLVSQAVEALAVPPARCALVGDSATDLHAARAAGTRAIGYANKPGKAERFAAERPGAVVTSMTVLDRVVRAWGPGGARSASAGAR
ncbi:HAD family hydrolase [Actinosynnema sp. NPDC059335]|uniref:HAD family hydrolase n=1 Tax=Actinosynnema sp. NPDC059335 TaxID=3346804 RepID=UPI00367094F8